jgi:sulfoacetaldehyde acetyltransferase
MRLLSQADVVLALGCRFNPFGLVPQYGIDFFPREARVIQVDIDAKQIGRTKPIELGIVGDARLAAVGILEKLKHRAVPIRNGSSRRSKISEERGAWAKELESISSSDKRPMSPRRALKELAAALPADAIVSTDIGNICSMANSYLRFNRPRTFLPALTFGNCGFSYPGALGGKLASPESPVVSIVGDGAWGMSLAEVMTAVQEKIDVLAVIFNNNEWGAEKRNQIDFYDSRFVGTNLVNPDFAQIARDMGAFGEKVESASELGESIKRGLNSGKPGVLNVIVDPNELAEPFRRDALMRPVRFLPRYK